MRSPFDCISDFIFVETEMEKAEVILIPGGSHPQLMTRAAALYHQGLAPYILPSGGANSKLPSYASEWEFLKMLAVQAGVPEAAILKEDRASNTFENARFSWMVLQEQHIPAQKAILVCKAFHARRALLTYQTVFPRGTIFHVAPVTDNRGIRKDNWFLNQEHIHIVMGEVVKIGTYFEDKVLANPQIPEAKTEGA